MFEQFRFNTGLHYARLRFRSKRDRVINFTDVLLKAHRALVIFPESIIDVDATTTILRYLLRRFSNDGLLVLIREDLLFSLTSAPPVKTLTYSQKDITRWFIPRHSLISRLLSNTFDVALDLNTALQLPSAFLCKASRAPLRIGFVKPNGDEFYNFQVQIKTSTNALSVYKNFLKCLDMF